MQDAGEFMREIADYIGHLIGTSGQPLRLAVLGECPHCGAAVIEGKRAFGCSQWRSGCGFVLPRAYRGVTLSTTLVRELLQRRIVVNPHQIDGEARVLRMTAGGAIEDLEVPKRERQQRDDRNRRKQGTTGKKPRVATALPSPARAKSAGGCNKSTATKNTTTQLCHCPQCGQPIVEGAKSYACSGWREGCRVTVWKAIAGKTITKSMAAKLLTKGKTPLLKGFVSKSGKPFEARLVRRGDRVEFEFAGS